jgi:CheY-like chemotaxis protein/two-component sensor histidine kinase
VILGWTEVLARDKSLSPTAKRGVGAVKRSAKAQAQLISDLLDASRITSGKLGLTMEIINPLEISQAALEALDPVVREKQIEMSIDLDPSVSMLKGDASRFQQIIWNLVTNAVKFTSKGGRISVSLKSAGAWTELKVRDSGQGIRPEILPVIFERFRQGDSSASRVHGGLGLGLAITHHIVESHGGTISAESAGEGRGATFTVLLPAGDPSFATEEEPAPSRLDLHKLRVLVVEDDLNTREFMEQVLSECRADVKLATSSSEAIEAVDSFRPEVLISDIGMPGEDGYALIRKIRERGVSVRELPAIALTAYAHQEDQQKALAAGYQMHLAKPVNVQRLTEAILRVSRR